MANQKSWYKVGTAIWIPCLIVAWCFVPFNALLHWDVPDNIAFAIGVLGYLGFVAGVAIVIHKK
ncbi:MAG: hypothetical protein KJ954_14225 [Alphaproteobacteria bacterium]|nr:hypothetical protein [Alphaproteobacteria bacterium]